MKRKTQFLKGLDTKAIVIRMRQLEDDLETVLKVEAEYKHSNAEYLSSYSSDCRAVDELLAGLNPPTTDGKLTVDQRKAWQIRQRSEFTPLREAVQKQRDVAFQLENYRIDVDMTQRRLDGMKHVLSLKTAQIRFLTPATDE